MCIVTITLQRSCSWDILNLFPIPSPLRKRIYFYDMTAECCFVAKP